MEFKYNSWNLNTIFGIIHLKEYDNVLKRTAKFKEHDKVKECDKVKKDLKENDKVKNSTTKMKRARKV